MSRRLIMAGLLAALAACAAPRFRDQPIVWRVNDTRDIPEPAEREFFPYQYMTDVFAWRWLPRAMELRDREPAHNTNALDEVPDSTWFTNRIGVRQVTPKEAAWAEVGRPPQLPLTIVRGKSGGGNPGFFAKDTTGRTFLIKFDTKENPEMQTAVGVIVNRIFWVMGYNTPSDHVFIFRRSDLTLDPRATTKDERHVKKKMTQKDVDEQLASSPRRPDGSYRAFASQFLPGRPLGGIAPEGLRPDDPNDHVLHEHRRELRGLRVFCAWTNHTDMKEDNTLDMYVEANGKRFVRHYFIDFGEALGAHVAEKNRYEDGWEHYWDWELNLAAVFTLGLWKRPWEDEKETPWLSIGSFSADVFQPRKWRETYPYWPFTEMDAADAYWGAKIVMRFDRPLLEAVVARGQLSHPEAARYLVDTLLKRRDAVGRVWLEAVTPFDDLTMRGGQLCGVDLGVRFGLATSGVLERLDDRDEVLSDHTVDRDGRVCLPVPAHERYTVYRLRIRRGRDEKPAMQVHFKGGPRARILGVIRVEH